MALRIGMLSPLLALDPATAPAILLPALSPLYQTLIRQDKPDEEREPDLADGWEISSDATLYRFRLAPAQFHDGSPVTAQGVLISIARHVWPGSKSIFASTLRPLIHGADRIAQDAMPSGLSASEAERSIEIRLTAPYVPFLDILAHPALGIARAAGRDSFIGSGPMLCTALRRHDWANFERHPGYRGRRRTPDKLYLVGHKSLDMLAAAAARREIDVVIADRKQQIILAQELASTPLRDKWVAMLVLNGGGGFGDHDLRRDFGKMVQTLAREHFGTSFNATFLPSGLAPEDYYQRPKIELDAHAFADRWRAVIATQPLRIIHEPGRGALTAMVERLIAALAENRVPHCVLPTNGPDQVYAHVAEGAFDVAARGWMQDFDDFDEYFGAFTKQAPGPAANLEYERFFAAIDDARHLSSPTERTRRYCAALTRLENEGLFVPLCQDRIGLLHHQSVSLQAGGREPFDLE